MGEPLKRGVRRPRDDDENDGIRRDGLPSARRSPLLKAAGFRVSGRTFNRITPDGLTQVIGFQMGSFDPPGTTYIPGLRENLYGRFTVNLGVYVPEVAKHHGGGEAGKVVQDYHCCVRARLGEVGPENADLWWLLSPTDALRQEMCDRLAHHGLRFLARFESRDAILREWDAVESNQFAGNPPRIVKAIILVERGPLEAAVWQRLVFVVRLG